MIKKVLILMLVLLLYPVCAFAQLDSKYVPSKNSIIAFVEFDENDDTSLWGAFSSTGVFSSYKLIGNQHDGILETSPQNTSFGRWGIRFGVGDNAYKVATSSKNIYLCTKFKVVVTDGKKTAKDITTNILAVDGKCLSPALESKGIVKVGITSGKFSYGDEAGMTASNFDISLDQWYYIKIRLDYSSKKAYATIWDDNLSQQNYEWSFLWGCAFENITQVTLLQNDKMGVTYYTDYLYVWDDSFKVSSSSIDDNADDVRADASIIVDFTKPVDEDSVKIIEITNLKGKKVPVSYFVDDTKATIFPTAGLEYDTSYKLLIPSSVKDCDGNNSIGKTIEFHTEYPPFRICDEVTNVNNNMVGFTAKVNNITGDDKSITILTLMYDSDLNLVGIRNESIRIPTGSLNYDIALNYNIDEVEVNTAYSIVWNGLLK